MSLGQVSFEKPNEWEFITTLMRGAGIQELWTSGRLCDAEVNGCDAPHYQPLNINGWFWASTLVQMLPTNRLVLCKAPSVPQPVVQSRRRPLLGPSPG